uniref:Tubulin tyrosine ligase like 10 n=1 Tax=Strigops habroptila TaxID=2489341 RepID=A0A672U6B2_STRHB
MPLSPRHPQQVQHLHRPPSCWRPRCRSAGCSWTGWSTGTSTAPPRCSPSPTLTGTACCRSTTAWFSARGVGWVGGGTQHGSAGAEPPVSPPCSEQARLAPSVLQREKCRALLQQLQARLPQLRMEGVRNLWILKPGAESRGRGITCSAWLEEVLELAGKCTAPSLQPGQWVVEKYVEQPLLILGNKFVLRQWFLVTDWNPLTIWFYRDSYVRFCSRPFSLHRSGWRLSGGRHSKLPRDLIWSSQQFQLYLQRAGHTEAWEKLIMPGMREAVVAALRGAQELVEGRKGSFELYGADFMFREDCQPWLLEINAGPSLEPCSAVTQRLCAAVLCDTLRMVLDHRENPGCSTGAFELIYTEVGLGGL